MFLKINNKNNYVLKLIYIILVILPSSNKTTNSSIFRKEYLDSNYLGFYI